ncbi:MAG: Tfp pilus assembly protein FimT/FimU [Verrucomicrobiota bacterium]
MTIPGRIKTRRRARGFTLFEILLALGIVGVLIGVSVPLVMESFGDSATEGVARSVEEAVQSARASALETGEARRFGLADRGLVSLSNSIPNVELPEGWKLQVRRFSETRFRRPERGEFWEINGAGICEPITLKLVGEEESTTMQFDPLTGQVLPPDE